MRFFPAVLKLQEMIASGVVGDVKLVQASLGKQSSKRTERHYNPKLGQLVTRDETILQYIDILQYLLQQYNTIQLKGNINILHIAIYCDILQYIAMFVVLML